MVALAEPAAWLAVLLGTAVAVAPRRAWSRAALGASSATAVLATAGLAWALVDSDLRFAYVADHSRRGASAGVRLAGLWAGMGGSLLFLGAVSALVVAVAAVATRRAAPAVRAVLDRVGAAAVVVPVALALVLADPFARLDIPAIDGGGLMPILEHAAMLYHPPLLYLGLTLLVPAFALALAPRPADPDDATWWPAVRPWLLASWTVLALGMLAGAHWAYAELGWGGYWAWDPVENAALLPWLATTAALHAGLVGGDVRRRVVPLVLLAFAASVLAAYLTRSGATSSVHAFAEARSVGRALLVVLAVVGAVSAHVWRAERRRAGLTTPRWLAVQHVVVLSAFSVVVCGSLWPLVEDLAGRERAAVEGTYFARFLAPLALMGLATIAWRHRPRPLGWRGWATAVALAAIGAGLARRAGWSGTFALLTAALGPGAVVVSATAWWRQARRPGGVAHVGGLAHVGFTLLLVGVAASSTGHVVVAPLRAGDTISVDGHRIELRALAAERVAGGRQAVVATVAVDGSVRRPQLVAHADRGVLLAESRVRSDWRGDVQLMLRDATEDGVALLQIGVHPLQWLVWASAALLVVAGALGFAGTAAAQRRSRRRRWEASSASSEPVRSS